MMESISLKYKMTCDSSSGMMMKEGHPTDLSSRSENCGGLCQERYTRREGVFLISRMVKHKRLGESTGGREVL